MTAGYSATPLARKLGIRPGQRVLFDRAPTGFDQLIAPLPDGVDVLRRAVAPLDLVVTFATSASRLARRVAELEPKLAPDGALWTAWPKRSSGVATDLTGNVLRELLLPPGVLVDVKVCAIDDTWSGLKFVIRTGHRGDR